MARPNKQGLDYFPYDVDLDTDDKLQMIIASHGYKGELIYTKMLCWIYKNEGYYTEWNEMSQLKFAARVSYAIGSAQVNLIKEVVSACIKWGLFNKSVFESSQILTSDRIQRTWLDASRKRKERIINEKIWLLGVNDALEPEETELIPEVTHKVKGKESKVKETKVKKKEEGAKIPDFHPPSSDEVFIFFKEKGFTTALAKKAFDYYQDRGWHDSRNNPVRDWKTKMEEIWMKGDPGNDTAFIFPDKWSKDFENKLGSIQNLQDYWKHLREKGLKPVKNQRGDTIKWE